MVMAFQLRLKGGTTDEYDQARAKMGFSPGGEGPPGLLFHWVAEVEDGLLVTDVWQTQEAFDSFASAKIDPFIAELGLGPPDVTGVEVHNYLTARGR